METAVQANEERRHYAMLFSVSKLVQQHTSHLYFNRCFSSPLLQFPDKERSVDKVTIIAAGKYKDNK